MAELKAAEHALDEIRDLYSNVKSHDSLKSVLPELKEVSVEGDDQAVDPDKPEPCTLPHTELVEQIDLIRNHVTGLDEKVAKFRKRVSDKDPVTGNSRYGANTLVRVERVIEQHQEFSSICEDLLNESKLSAVQSRAEKETEEARRLEGEAQERRDRERLEEQARERAILEEEQRKQEEIKQQREVERAEAQRIAREAVEAEELARLQADQTDREWEAGVPRGVEGARACLFRLVDATKNDQTLQQTAIDALHTLFSQIVARPEETDFRRIRRDHPKFNADIGQHDGGKEFLIATGFRLGEIDNIPCFISSEPNLEKDMDGWAAWFDLKKAALEIIEEQMMK